MNYLNKNIHGFGSNIGPHTIVRGILLSAVLLFAGAQSLNAQDLPTGGVVIEGTGTISTSGTDMTIQQGTNNLSIDWNSFDIGAGNMVEFKQPSTSATALNRITGGSGSDIMGTLKSNGRVFIVNPSGVLFGRGAQVNMGGITASTLDISATDFRNGNYIFSGSSTANLIHEGRIVAVDGVAMIATKITITDTASISAGRGGISLSAGGTVKLNFGSAWGVEVSAATVDTLIEQGGALRVTDGMILLEAKSAGLLLKQMISHTGTSVSTKLTKDASGAIHFRSSGHVSLAGDSSVTAADISVTASSAMLGGVLDASATAAGVDGGSVGVTTTGRTNLAGSIKADSATANGGVIKLATGSVIESSSGRTSANGAVDGGQIAIATTGMFMSSGQYSATGGTGAGGRIDVGAADVRLLGSKLLASGGASGGLVRIGGAFQGGKVPDTSKSYYDSFVGRWGALAPLASAGEVYVGSTVEIDVSSKAGAGGTAIIWSDTQTTFLGGIDARGTASAGSVEISSAANLRHASLSNVQVGAGGTLLLDPRNITIATSGDASSWSYSAIIGAGYGAKSKSVGGIATGDQFGISVALNGAGDRLAVGAKFDDGGAVNAGAVYLFSFTDTNFSGGTLSGVIGKGYAQSGSNKNIDLGTLLLTGDLFGASVAFSKDGKRLAVGAPGDDGIAITSISNGGAVYLFSFKDKNFNVDATGATSGHVGTIGAGYTKTASVTFGGAQSINLNASGAPANAYLDPSEAFGSSVAFNGAGDRLVVGAAWDGGSGHNVGATYRTGAVYLFSFADTSNVPFATGTVSGMIGDSYTTSDVGLKSINLSILAANDNFGTSVSLSDDANTLVVGAIGDDAFDGAGNNQGAVYLFNFTNGDFTSGTTTTGHVGTIGSGYVKGSGIAAKSISVANLGATDNFGESAALNGLGTRLAVGAPNDDGTGTAVAADAGAVYLFSFTDAAFTPPTPATPATALVGTIGSGYTQAAAAASQAAKDISAKSINFGVGAGDQFGYSIAFNTAGDRMVVGAPYDDGSGDPKSSNVLTHSDAGAVHLFSFMSTSGGTSTDFAPVVGGANVATIGSGYISSPKNINMAAQLGIGSEFGASVALNGDGTRLAVGAARDDGATGGGISDNYGAVYLFSFTDGNFTGGSLTATIGKGYTTSLSGKNIDLALGKSDYFGRSVAFNAIGDRLAVGAYGDDGASGGTLGSGAVYLFTFTDTSFSGGNLVGTIGAGYKPATTGTSAENAKTARSINLVAADSTTALLDTGDWFGASVAFNAIGDRLAVGAYRDDGVANASLTNDSGAVYLFAFATQTDGSGVKTTDFSKITANVSAHVGTIGSGYVKGNANTISANSIDLSTPSRRGITQADEFGSSVAFNGLGNMLVVGAHYDNGLKGGGSDGSLNNLYGAVHLFSFSDTSFGVSSSAYGHVGTIGSGYMNTDPNSVLYGGPKSINLALDLQDIFGASVALNAAGDSLAVGAWGDDGSGVAHATTNNRYGAVYLFSFKNGDFTPALSSGAHVGTIGSGYTPDTNTANKVKSINLALSVSDYFGYSVAFNAAGDRLVASAVYDNGGGVTKLNSPGGVYLFAHTGVSLPNGKFGFNAGDDVTMTPLSIKTLLDAGTSVVLQASNNIKVDAAIAGTAAGTGKLTLQAGNSILLNADITTGTGGLSLIANETLANGVINAHRLTGNAAITMAPGKSITSAGAVSILLKASTETAKTNKGVGDITLGSISGTTIKVINKVATKGVILASGAALATTATGSNTDRALQIQGETFKNEGGTLTATGGTWLVWSKAAISAADLGSSITNHDFFSYEGTAFVVGTNPIAATNGKSGFVYSTAGGTVTAILTATTAAGMLTKTYDKSLTANVTKAGLGSSVANGVTGDAATFSAITAAKYTNVDAGTAKTITVTGVVIGGVKRGTGGSAKDVYGYTVAGGGTVSANIGIITKAILTTLPTDIVNSKVYDGELAATFKATPFTEANGIVGSSSDAVTLKSTSTGSFTSKNVFISGGSVAPHKVTTDNTKLVLEGADAKNYKLKDGELTTTGTITQMQLTVADLAAAKRQKIYDGSATDATGQAVTAALGSIQKSENITVTAKRTFSGGTAKNAGDKTVSVAYTVVGGGAVSGKIAGLATNYKPPILQSFTGAGVVKITQATLTLSGAPTAGAGRAYDGTATSASIVAGSGLQGFVTGETGTGVAVSINAALTTATYLGADAKNKGTGKSITVAYTLKDGTGGKATNYMLAPITISGGGVITARILTSGVSSGSLGTKEYDGTNTLTGLSANGALGVASGSIGGLTTELSKLKATASGTFTAGGDVGNDKDVTVTLAPAFKDTTDQGGVLLTNYKFGTVSGSRTASITPRTLELTDILLATKTYDGNEFVAVTNKDAIAFKDITKIVNNENVTLVKASVVRGEFLAEAGVLNKDVKIASGAVANKTLQILGLTLGGTKAGNYTLNVGIAKSLVEKQAKINPVTLSLAAPAASAPVATARAYNGLATVGIAARTLVTTNVVSSETVTLSGAVVGTLTGGADAGLNKAVAITQSLSSTNYAIRAADLTATVTIAKRQLTFSAGTTITSRAYNATLTTPIVAGTLATTGLTGLISGKEVTVTATGAHTNKNVGTRDVSVSYQLVDVPNKGKASNYLAPVTGNVSGTITAKALTIVDAVKTKIYDGNDKAKLDMAKSSSLNGVVAVDSETITLAAGASGTFSGGSVAKNIGTAKTLTLTGLVLSGTAAGNYSLAATATLTAGAITKRTLTVTGLTADNKVSDGTTTAKVNYPTTTPIAFGNIVKGEDTTGAFTLTKTEAEFKKSTFADALVGNNKDVTVKGLTLGGTAAGNYQLGPNGNLVVKANITAVVTAGDISPVFIPVARNIIDNGFDADIQPVSFAPVAAPVPTVTTITPATTTSSDVASGDTSNEPTELDETINELNCKLSGATDCVSNGV